MMQICKILATWTLGAKYLSKKMQSRISILKTQILTIEKTKNKIFLLSEFVL